jgi:23S rRNA (adenine2503-C2)-methyltransferase
MGVRVHSKESGVTKKLSSRPDLLSLDRDEMRGLLTVWKVKPYRAQQLFGWIYGRCVTDLSEMKNLPAGLRDKLKENLDLGTVEIAGKQVSPERDAVKFVFVAADGREFEAVLMGTEKRATLCLSTQIGCKLDCRFCATGRMGFVRDLSAGEIVAQYIFLRRELTAANPRINIVVMGMGEPMLNWHHTAKALRLLTDEAGANIGKRRITVSTAGIVPVIRRLAEDRSPWSLAISLNAASDESRNRLMPINRQYPIKQLVAAAHMYARRTRRRVTIEYVLIKDVNDSRNDALQLARLASQLPCKVNVIPYNAFPGASYESPSESVLERFTKVLYPRCPAVTVRRSKGASILAACGQLARKQVTGNRH